MTSVLFDTPGPRGRLRIRLATVVGIVLVLALVVIAGLRLAENNQLEGERWAILLDFNTGVPQSLLEALLATLQAAAVAMVFSVVLGALLAVGRLSNNPLLRIPCGLIIEFFRAVPLLLLIFFSYLGLPLLGVPISPFWALVLGLTAYNMAVLAEIFRAGILSIDRGQSEAAYALGMRKTQVMALILIPQAVRRMLPVLVSQLVVLLKDTSLGFIVSYFELLRQARSNVEFFGSRYGFQLYVAAAVIYILINLIVSSLARYLDKRTARIKTVAVAKDDLLSEAALAGPRMGAGAV